MHEVAQCLGAHGSDMLTDAELGEIAIFRLSGG
jgi:hypothetical protein